MHPLRGGRVPVQPRFAGSRYIYDAPVDPPHVTHADSSLRRRLPLFVAGVALVLAIVACYARVGSQSFVMWDDPGYAAERRIVHEGLTAESIAWAFTTFAEANWHPLTWLSLMLDVQLWGVNAGAMKWTNVAIHAASTLLLLWFLVSATGSRWRSVIVTALFALHPLRVESVAWVSERKDVLSACLGLLALCAYVQYARRPSIGRMAAVAGCYALSLLAKPTLVTFPCLLLLLDVWPLRRWQLPWMSSSGASDGTSESPFAARSLKELITEKIPLLVLTAASCVVTYEAQALGGAVNSFEQVGLGVRFANAFAAVGRYLSKTFWPVDLAFFYPHAMRIEWPVVIASAAVMVAITAAAIAIRRRSPALLVGWLWFLGTLVPVVGIVQVGGQSMADRYTYIPSIGLLIALVWIVPAQASKSKLPTGVGAGVLAAVVALALAWQTTRQVRHWDGNHALFEHAIRVTKDNYIGHLNLGGTLVLEKKYDQAIEQFREVVRIRPGNAMGYHAYGRALADLGRDDEAIAMYRTALSIRPNYGDALCNSAPVLERAGFVEEAMRNLQQAVRVDPENATFQRALGMAYVKRGDVAKAIPPLLKSAELDPNDAGTLNNLGVALNQAGRVKDALPFLKRAVELRPKDVSNRENLTVVLVGTGDFSGASEQLRAVLAMTKDSVELRSKLAFVLARAGRTAEAAEHLEKAIELSPSEASLRNELGKVLAQSGRIDDAVKSFEEAVRLAPEDNDYKANLAKAKAMKP